MRDVTQCILPVSSRHAKNEIRIHKVIGNYRKEIRYRVVSSLIVQWERTIVQNVMYHRNWIRMKFSMECAIELGHLGILVEILFVSLSPYTLPSQGKDTYRW